MPTQPKPVTDITTAEAVSPDDGSVADLQKEFQELKAEAESVLLLSQTPPSFYACLAYSHYSELASLKERSLKLPGTLAFALPSDFDKTFREVAEKAAVAVYEKVKKDGSLGCRDSNSDIIENTASMIDQLDLNVGYRPEKVIRDAYLKAVRPEIAALAMELKNNPDEYIKKDTMLLVGHAENVWQFTPAELGVSARLQKQLFPDD
ncbi:MAG: hypothetical protein HY507_00605 [Candidatus Zambryskibacteria bacterium]|nr:hypothetical protein [Candidatus Zambryskibacteria bacterium]